MCSSISRANIFRTRSRSSSSGMAGCRFMAARSACWSRCSCSAASKLSFFAFADIITAAIPIGLFFGRVANFINSELWGRPTDVPWGVIFPNAPGPEPRHPSQLYEAGLEGIVLFLILFALARFTRIRERPGALSGVFLIGYALARIFVEFFREPDSFMGYLWFGATMGQLLSVPVFLLGVWSLWQAKPRK